LASCCALAFRAASRPCTTRRTCARAARRARSERAQTGSPANGRADNHCCVFVLNSAISPEVRSQGASSVYGT